MTGGGKTIFALRCILEFRHIYPQGHILIIVPTLALLDQWYVSLREDLGLPDDAIGIYSGEEKAQKERIVNLLVINTARKIAVQLACNHDTFLVVDECHRAGSPMNALALRGHHQATLGLSATPQRAYDQGFQEYLVPVLGPIIYDYDYQQAIQDGVITRFELINLRVELLPFEQSQVEQLSRRIAMAHREREDGRLTNREYLKHLLLRRASVVANAAMRVPVASKIVDINRGQRTLVFHERVEAANTIQHILKERGHSATIYHSQVGPFIRRSNLRLYRRGIFDTLVTCRALDEGLNVPETTLAVIASSTASNRQRIQRLGRVLRPAPGKTTATVYTIYATDQEERALLREAQGLRGLTTTRWERSSE